ncbi:MAG: tetratricopeptide repeat protein [Deltaproteobacteria bacterium]|nr:tetratricopeptide repeat protein [Deltaproteobacteria bacterium]
MSTTRRVYNVWAEPVLLCFVFIMPLMLGCGGAITARDRQVRSRELLDAINTAREAEGLSLLEMDEVLTHSAGERAQQAAANGAIAADENRLPKLVAAGSFARFALSHGVKEGTLSEAANALIEDPLAKSKVLHGRLTHVGFGFSGGKGGVFATMDLARLVPIIDLDAAREELVQHIREKRSANSVEELEIENSLDEPAGKLASQFIEGTASSDELIAEAKRDMGSKTFAIGRVTITFQVAGDVEGVVVPSMISDPALSYLGIGLAQGNHPDHESGSLAVVLFLGKPQTAHDAHRQVSNLPPPKSAPTSGGGKKKGSLAERAWIATLTGNHRKAANLFKKAYKSKKDPALLYEAARAQARNEDYEAATKLMHDYAKLVEGDEKKKAYDLLSRLELGETIFSKSEEQKMSVETKRFFVIGQRLFEQGEWDGAIDAFQQAYVYSPHPDIIYNIGLAHCRAGRIGEALEFFGEYQKHVPKARSTEEAKQLFEIGVELYKAGQFEAASSHFAMTYAFMPFPELIYNLGLCHMAMGQKDMALRFLREFLDTDPPKKARAEVEDMILDISVKKKTKNPKKSKNPVGEKKSKKKPAEQE